jgi:hypothetical protein
MWAKLGRILQFVVHQIVGTYGIAACTTFALGLTLDFLGPIGRSFGQENYHFVLTDIPFFPLQLCTGFCAGWFISRKLRDRSMIWVWVLPLMLLLWALADLPSISPSQLTSVMMQPSVGQNRWSHYFGWGCRTKYGCLDQLVITLPFYAAVVYSFGAYLEQRRGIQRGDVGTMRCPSE